MILKNIFYLATLTKKNKMVSLIQLWNHTSPDLFNKILHLHLEKKQNEILYDDVVKEINGLIKIKKDYEYSIDNEHGYPMTDIRGNYIPPSYRSSYTISFYSCFKELVLDGRPRMNYFSKNIFKKTGYLVFITDYQWFNDMNEWEYLEKKDKYTIEYTEFYNGIICKYYNNE